MPSQDGGGRRQGIVAEWNDERGFGFIRPMTGGARLFVHVSAFPRGLRPVVGSLVTYVEGRDERGSERAGSVQYLKPPTASRRSAGPMSKVVAAVVTFFAVLAILVLRDKLPATLLAAYLVLSLVAFLTYGKDKSAAEHGNWRTPESTLHVLALVGGWPGALIAQPYFNHKTSKQPFRTFFWITVVANCVALAWFIYETPVALP